MRRLKKIYIFIGVLILLIFFGGAVFFFFQNKKEESQKEFVPDLSKENLEQNSLFRGLVQNREKLKSVEECDSLINKDAKDECISWYFRAKAKEEKNVSLCEEIPLPKTRDRCIFDVAVGKDDLTACDMITNDSTKTSCRDKVLIQKNTPEKNLNDCLQVSTPLGQGNCARRLFSRLRDVAECGIYKETGFLEECVWVVTTRLAYKKSDPTLCDALENVSSQESCRDPFDENTPFIADIDRDGDGLSYEEEMNFGSSDDTKDTDGDGFDDKTEIENGYNPLGEGKQTTK